MNKKKIIIIILIILILLTIGIYYILTQKQQEKIEEFQEYTPQEEISQEQLRQTIVTLYFKNKETGEIMPEARSIDAKELVQNPYFCLVNMLIIGPKNENLETTIPQGTILQKAEINNDTVVLDFSEEFINNHPGGAEEENKTINSIVNTLTELTEVNKVKILINGEENKSYNDNLVSFKDPFARVKNTI